MKLQLLLILTVIYTANVFAGNTNDILRQTKQCSDVGVKNVLQKNHEFKRYGKILNIKNERNEKNIKKIQHYQSMIGNMGKINLDTRKNPNPECIVFVSLSMPELSLKQIIDDAYRYQVPVVIRGLYQNSFIKTAEKIFDLVKVKNKGGILINPPWFRHYAINVVPAVVVSRSDVRIETEEKREKQMEGKKKNFDVVYGNIPLKRALSLIAQDGEAKDIAKMIMARVKAT